MSNKIFQLFISIFLITFTRLCGAEIITFQFEGVVTSSNKLTAFPLGQTVSGKYSFDSTVADVNSGNLEQGVYENVTFFTFTSGAVTGVASSETSAGGSFVEVIFVNRNTGFDPQRYEVFSPCSNTPDDKCEVEAEGEELRRMRFLLQNDGGTEIQSIALPLEPPIVENFGTREFGLIFQFDSTNDPGVKFNITSLTQVESPEPEIHDDLLLLMLPAIISAGK